MSEGWFAFYDDDECMFFLAPNQVARALVRFSLVILYSTYDPGLLIASVKKANNAPTVRCFQSHAVVVQAFQLGERLPTSVAQRSTSESTIRLL